MKQVYKYFVICMLMLVASGCLGESSEINTTEQVDNDDTATDVIVENANSVNTNVNDVSSIQETVETPVADPVVAEPTNTTKTVVTLNEASSRRGFGGGSSGGSSGHKSSSTPTVIKKFSVDFSTVDVAGDGPEGVAQFVGDIITYKLVVTNSGNTGLSNIEVLTSLRDTIISAQKESITQNSVLDIGETFTYEIKYKVTDKDVTDKFYRLPCEVFVICEKLEGKSDFAYANVELIRAYNLTVISDSKLVEFEDQGVNYKVVLENTGSSNLTDLPFSLIIEGDSVSVSNSTISALIGETVTVYNSTYIVTKSDIESNGKDQKPGYLDIEATVGSASNTLSIPLKYEYTTISFNSVYEIGNKTHSAVLINNKQAVNASSQIAINDFLLKDETEKLEYDNETFDAFDFASVVHNNAEKAGIKSNIVEVEFTPVSENGEIKQYVYYCNAFRFDNGDVVFTDSCYYDATVEIKRNEFLMFTNISDTTEVIQHSNLTVDSYEIF